MKKIKTKKASKEIVNLCDGNVNINNDKKNQHQ